MKKIIISVFVLTITVTGFVFPSHVKFAQNYKSNIAVPIITDTEIDQIYKKFDIVETSQEPTKEQIVFTTIAAQKIMSAYYKNDYPCINFLLSNVNKSQKIHPSLLRNIFFTQQRLSVFHDKKSFLKEKNLFALQQAATRSRQDWQKNLWKQEDFRKELKEIAKLTEQFKALEPRIQQSRLLKVEERSRKIIEKKEKIETILIFFDTLQSMQNKKASN